MTRPYSDGQVHVLYICDRAHLDVVARRPNGRVQTWPAEAVRAIATSPGVRAAMVAWPSGRCVNCGEDIYEHSYDDAVGCVLAALGGTDG